MSDSNSSKKRTFSGIEVYYEEYGKGENTILLLHGWGQSHAFWKILVPKLAEKYHVYVLDLPGFGLSQEPPMTWNVKNYADFIHDFVTALKINNPILLGHSFGGRIASVYASLYPVKKLILYSNGGLPIVSLKTKFNKHVVVNIGRFLFPNFLYKSHTRIFKPKDYDNKIILNAKRSRRMLDIYAQPFFDITKYFEKIKAQTLIIYGGKDFIVSPEVGRQLHQLIKNSQIVEVSHATHFAHIEAPKVFDTAVEKFLEEK